MTRNGKSGHFMKILFLVAALGFGTLILNLVFQAENVRATPEQTDVLHTLLAKDQIIETLNHLFIGTDNRDWAKVKEVFAPQVLFDMTSLAGGEAVTLSSQEIVDSWDQGLKPLQAVHHQVGNFIVDVNGSEADAFCYGIASHYLPNPTNQNTRVFVGSYNFHLVKDGDQWRIDHFKFNLKYLDGNPNLEGN